jgi:hypothetical protein
MGGVPGFSAASMHMFSIVPVSGIQRRHIHKQRLTLVVRVRVHRCPSSSRLGLLPCQLCCINRRDKQPTTCDVDSSLQARFLDCPAPARIARSARLLTQEGEASGIRRLPDALTLPQATSSKPNNFLWGRVGRLPFVNPFPSQPFAFLLVLFPLSLVSLSPRWCISVSAKFLCCHRRYLIYW